MPGRWVWWEVVRQGVGEAGEDLVLQRLEGAGRKRQLRARLYFVLCMRVFSFLENKAGVHSCRFSSASASPETVPAVGLFLGASAPPPSLRSEGCPYAGASQPGFHLQPRPCPHSLPSKVTPGHHC